MVLCAKQMIPSSHLDCFVWYLAVYFFHLAVWYIPIIVCSLVVVKECGVPAFSNHIVQRNLCCYQRICAAIRALCCYQRCASLKHETSLLPQKWLSAKSEKDKQELQVRRCTTFTHIIIYTTAFMEIVEIVPIGIFKQIRYCSGGVRCRIMIPVLTMMRRRVTEGQSRMYKMLERRCSRTDGERLGFFSHWTWNGGTVTLSIFFHDLHSAHYNTLLSHNCTG